jgi:hypothetical protein
MTSANYSTRGTAIILLWETGEDTGSVMSKPTGCSSTGSMTRR